MGSHLISCLGVFLERLWNLLLHILKVGSSENNIQVVVILPDKGICQIFLTPNSEAVQLHIPPQCSFIKLMKEMDQEFIILSYLSHLPTILNDMSLWVGGTTVLLELWYLELLRYQYTRHQAYFGRFNRTICSDPLNCPQTFLQN